MKQDRWMPFLGHRFWSSARVGAMEDGAVGLYLWLLWQEYTSGPFPADTATVRRMSGRFAVDFDRYWPQVEPCFAVVEGRFRNTLCEELRLDEERIRALKIKAGQASGAARRTPVERAFNTCTAVVEQVLNTNPTQPNPTSSSTKSTQKRASRASASPPVPDALPREIDTPEVQSALADYQESRREQGHKPLKPQGLKAMYGKLARWGPEGAVAALRDSIANGYQGVFLPKGYQANGSPQLFASEKSMSNIRNVIAKIEEAKEARNGKALQSRPNVRALPEPDRERGDLLGLPGRPPRDAG